ncbi:MAG: glycosyltransferase family 4 protein [Pseudomonadota bacterium]
MNTNQLDVTLCSALVEGGIAHYSYCLANALQAAGVNTTQLMFGWPEYELRDYPHRQRVVTDLRVANSRLTRLTSPLRNLQVMLRTAARSQIVHLQWSLGARTDRLHLPVLRALGKSLVYTAHDVLPHESDIMSEQHARWLYHSAGALFVHGENLKALLVGHFGVDPARVHVIPHGNYNFIPDTPGPWTRASARASLGLNEDDRAVLFFGLIRHYKGLDTLIEACRMLKDEPGAGDGQKLKLIIAGRDFRDHWREGGYEAAIRDGGLEGMVEIHKRHIGMDEIARFFRAADVLAVPYRRGSQSGVLRLAYSFGLPAVATSVGSLAEMSGDNVTSFVAPEDPAALASALGKLLANPELAREIGARARRYADNELDWDRIAQTTRSVYEGLDALRH